jgi:hypothetical protein
MQTSEETGEGTIPLLKCEIPPPAMTQSEDATVRIRQHLVRGSCDEVARKLEEF